MGKTNKKVVEENVAEVVAEVVEANADQVVEAAPEQPVAKEKPLTKQEMAQKEADAVDFTDEEFYGEGKTEFPVISRAAAIILGFRRYFTGEPCIKGHVAPRKTKSAACVVCTRERLKARKKTRMAEDADYKKTQYEKAKARRQAAAAAKKEAAAETGEGQAEQTA